MRHHRGVVCCYLKVDWPADSFRAFWLPVYILWLRPCDARWRPSCSVDRRSNSHSPLLCNRRRDVAAAAAACAPGAAAPRRRAHVAANVAAVRPDHRAHGGIALGPRAGRASAAPAPGGARGRRLAATVAGGGLGPDGCGVARWRTGRLGAGRRLGPLASGRWRAERGARPRRGGHDKGPRGALTGAHTSCRAAVHGPIATSNYRRLYLKVQKSLFPHLCCPTSSRTASKALNLGTRKIAARDPLLLQLVLYGCRRLTQRYL